MQHAEIEQLPLPHCSRCGFLLNEGDMFYLANGAKKEEPVPKPDHRAEFWSYVNSILDQ